MPCPHYSRENNDCVLLQELPRDDEEGVDSPVDDVVIRDLCLAQTAYRSCPAFKRFLADVAPRAIP